MCVANISIPNSMMNDKLSSFPSSPAQTDSTEWHQSDIAKSFASFQSFQSFISLVLYIFLVENTAEQSSDSCVHYRAQYRIEGGKVALV